MPPSLSPRRRMFLAAATARGAGGTGAGGVPVLVVAGYGGDVGSVGPLFQALERLERTVVVVPGADAGRGGIADSARLLTQTVNRLDARYVDVVGY